MVAIAQRLVIVMATIAGILGAFAESLPDTIPSTVPAMCVPVPLAGTTQLQVGYCP